MADDYYYCKSASQKLQSQIIEDHKFQNVIATYSGPVDHRVLTISGFVASEADENALRATADREFWGFKTTIRWRIRIASTGGQTAGFSAAGSET